MVILSLAGIWGVAGVRAAFASGDIRIDKSGFFNQTSGLQPASARTWYFSAAIQRNLSADMTTAQLYPPSWSPISMNNLSYPVDYSYGTQSALDAAFADGNYAFRVTSGNMSGDWFTLTMPASGFYPAEVPFLNSPSYQQLKNYNPSVPLQLTWNSFTPDARSTLSMVDLFVEDMSSYSDVFTTYSATDVPDFTSATIPALTLVPNHQYAATIVFQNDIWTNNAYFGTYSTNICKEYYTQISFTTVPEPGTLALLAVGALSFAAYTWRKRGRNADQME